jgi:phosphate:Na+ symporter
VIALLLGGIGLFLLGMTLLTDGLKVLAGDALRRVLARFTGGPLRATLSGAALTAMVQSSSATTLATIGFVSAGLLTFPQAVGVVYGANLGTTSTAWLVSLLGLKLSVSAVALPLVGVGALLRLLARDRWAALGTAIAGFGLVFVGIDTLQAGMADLAERIDPGSLPGASAGGRLVLLLVGAVMTVVMQSSSAAVATTLAGVHAGTISLEQAAALVIGQNIGTTIKAAIAAIGASVPVKRTALAHVLFNAITGLIALVILPLFVLIVTRLADGADAAVTLALFHTVFNLLGVAIFLPFTARFAAFVERVVRDRGPQLTRHLDPSVTHIPAVAVEAARRTLAEVAATAVARANGLIAARAEHDGLEARLTAADGALAATRDFLGRLRTETESAAAHARHLSNLHAIDHLGRLITACREPHARATGWQGRLEAPLSTLAAELDVAASWLAAVDDAAPTATLEAASRELAAYRRDQRGATLVRTARGELAPDAASRDLEMMRWIDRVGYHAWRAIVHLDPRAAATVSVEHGDPLPVAGE